MREIERELERRFMYVLKKVDDIFDLRARCLCVSVYVCEDKVENGEEQATY